MGVWPPYNVLLVWLLPAALPEVWGAVIGAQVQLVPRCVWCGKTRVINLIGAFGVAKQG